MAGPQIQRMLDEALRQHQAGHLDQAAPLYSKVLDADPGNASALYLLGMVLLSTGEAAAAAELTRKAIAIKGREGGYHFQLGAALQTMGDMQGALASYRRALVLQPGNVDTYNNMGNALAAQGMLDEARDCLRRALALQPDSAMAHCSLGALQWQMGRRDEAEASFLQAIALQPDYAAAIGNLGNIHRDKGALGEAQEFYARAYALAPHDVDLLNNFAALLVARNNSAAAMEMVRQSLTVRETGKARRLFAELVRQSGWNGASEEIRAVLVRALTEPWDRPGTLASAAAGFIKFNPAIGPLVEQAHAAWPGRLAAPRLLGDAGFAPLAEDDVLIALLTSAPNTDIALEHFLTMARAGLLGARDMPAGDALLRFAGALAQQCFINEFIFLPEDAETSEAARARAALAAALEHGVPVAPLHVLVVAAYFPLSGVAGAEKLLEQSWPMPVEAVLTQQIREPAQERHLRPAMARLTAIENGVSRMVQSQYEENPYPRWVRLAPETPDNIARFLSAKFPNAPFEPHPDRPMRDFLVAGCGTGQQSIATAQKFGASHLLAVDLSLASLCYAERKSGELGLAIEYGQADILELASLGRQFDVIECVGVLHHMADPFAGWQALLTLLRPNGFMKMGFYSEAARRPIAQERARIAARGIGSSADDIRKYRQDLMLSNDPGIRSAILNSEDFFSTSGCRDLMFHVQEHHMTLPQIRTFLESHRLGFLGFELHDAVLDAYRKRFMDDAAATNLAHWETFEAQHPGMFARMYEFWVWKAP